jgi:large subunit ribosomal protein L22
MATTDTPTAARATVRYLHTSPYKIRQVLALVRGLPVEDAERILQLCQKDAADDVLKLLSSAVANAEHNLSIEAEELFVARAWADEGPTRKWGQPRARGRYFRIRKRTSHVTIILERFAVDELAERRRRDEATGRGAAVAQRRRAERVRRSRQVQEVEPQTEAEGAEIEDEGDDSEATVGERSVESTHDHAEEIAAGEGVAATDQLDAELEPAEEAEDTKESKDE